jgi:hypothetical protein
MTGMRIEFDIEALVHQSYKGLPWHRRLFILAWPWISRKQVEAIAVAAMKGVSS